MASIPSFIFGAGTKYKTQEELEQAREQVREMLGDIGQSGYTGWGGVMADLGKGIGARIEKGRIGEGQEGLLAQQGPFSQTLAEIAGGYGGGGAGTDVLTGGGGGDDYLKYANANATRNQPLAPKLEQALGFLKDLGVTAEVFSGGQDATGPNRTGSHRHDEGNAGDMRFYKDGRRLSWKNKEDIPIFHEIVRRGKAAGITGWGAGEGYMGEGSMHVGYGTPAVWGAGGQGANAAGWLRDAYNGGGSNALAGGVGADPINDAFSRPPPSSGGGAPYRDAIASIESAGSGDYAAVGRPDPKLGRPLGRYQIMERNIGPWSKKHLGREVSAQEFLQNPAIQDAIFDGEFGGYVKKYGREGAAQAWLGGPGAVGKDDREDALGTSVGEYGRRFMGNLGGLGGGGGADVLAGSGRGPSLVQARPVPINEAGLRTPAGQEFLGRMSSPAPMGGGQQPPPLVPSMTGPMPPPPQVTPASVPIPPTRPAPVPPPQPVPALVPSTAPGRLSDEYVQPNAAQPPVPLPPRAPVPTAKVDPFTDMILGDKAAQFRPGNVSPPMAPGVAAGGLQAARQALAGGGGPLTGGAGANTMAGGAGTQFPAVPPAPGTPAAAGFGLPRAGGGGGAFPPVPPAPAPAPAQQRGGGGPQDVIGKLMFILASPWSSDDQKRMATAMLNREYALEDERRKAASPEAQLEMEYKQALIDKARAEAGGSGAPDFDDVSGVRKEITDRPSYKKLANATPIWESVVSAADRKTTQADLNIILGMAKIFDPESVVRTEEGEAVKDTGGASTELSKWFSYLKSNSDAVLDDNIRERLLAEGYSRLQGYSDEYKRDVEFFGQYADRNKINRQDIIREFPIPQPWKPGAASPSVKKKTDKFLGGGG